jgi:Mn-containing catalase
LSHTAAESKKELSFSPVRFASEFIPRSNRMFMHNKRLMHTVRVAEPNPRLATLMLEQFGGPQGELAAAMRYFTQALADEDPNRKDMLMDIATEELSHLEVIGNIVCMLNKGVKADMAEGAEQGQLLVEVFHGGESHTTSLLYGGGASLINSAGVPWTAAYVDSIGEPTCDLRSNIAAEARAKIIYERLINVTADPGVKEALGFLMTREISHQLSFEKALYSIEPNFPSGKLPGMPEFANVYVNTSQGEGDMRGPWNNDEDFEYFADRESFLEMGGEATPPQVDLTPEEEEAFTAMVKRNQSDLGSNPMTGAELGSGKKPRPM